MNRKNGKPQAACWPGLFLDRDGVLSEDRGNDIQSLKDVAFCEGSLEAMNAVGRMGVKIAIVSNQSAVGRGLLSPSEALEINQHIVESVVAYGGRIDGAFICPHPPKAGCRCRKPQPGLITRATDELNIDLGRSIMVGDAVTDLEAGARAGVAHLALVLTGRGSDQEQQIQESNLANLKVFRNLNEALRSMLPQAF